MHPGRILCLCFLVSMVAGCESRLAGLSDTELQDNVHECNTQSSQSPGFAISCDNYRRECERRREAGRYVC
ncbi:MAG: hypothetical protein R3E82_05600 [Pseudomonadales bacterium]|nr:hypothetical protein [Pseudomonadales bacterium]